MSVVLVVDDDTVSRLVLAHMVGRLGHDVHTADDAERAAELAELVRPDLVLCDQMLPGWSGTDLLHVLRQGGSEAAFVLVTGVPAAANAQYDGVSARLNKPIGSRALARCVERVLTASGRPV